jgi:hypothetical protein
LKDAREPAGAFAGTVNSTNSNRFVRSILSLF